MQITGASLKEELLDDLAREVAERVGAEQAPAVEHLLRRCYANKPPEEMLERPHEELIDLVLDLWRLGQQRTPGSLVARLHNVSASHEQPFDRTAIDLINDDMPFLLASVTAELNRRDRRIHDLAHPVVTVVRDGDGRFVRFGGADEGLAESWMRLEIDRETGGAEGLAELEDGLRAVLAQVRVAVGDWGPMMEKVQETLARLEKDPPPLDEDEVAEARAFLDWLARDHFTFLGYRRYRLETQDGNEYLRLVPGTGLGILREVSEVSEQRGNTPLPEYLSAFLHQRELLIITKSSRRAQVHRPAHMDSIGIRRFDAEGRVTGEDRFVGLFTSAVYNTSARTIPVLRRKARRVLEQADFRPATHDAKALAHILESFPRDELFQISEEDLTRIAMGILSLQQKRRVALFVRRDEFERFVSCLVYVPRERYDHDLRVRMQELLERVLGGQVTAFYTQMADAPMARVHFIVRTTPGEIPGFDVRQVEAALAELARSWDEHLREHLVTAEGDEDGLRLLQRWGPAFPPSYRQRYPAKAAIPDIRVMQRMLAASDDFEARLYRPPGSSERRMRLKLYSRGSHLTLSDALPVLENMGVRVESELPFEIELGSEARFWVHDFELRSVDAGGASYQEVKANFEETLRRVWSGDLENGILNRLVLCCRMQWHHVGVLRAYARYLRQIGITFSQRYMAHTLVKNPALAQQLLALFVTQFDPDFEGDREAQRAEVRSAIRAALETVKSLDEDRILRGFFHAIDATLRTSYYQEGPVAGRKAYVSVKLDCAAIPALPQPRPRFEIFVYSPRMEGVHLRGGLVARGGIRWSDRREDFRTEILGLLKAQMVKNAVIVPVGAKGGFVLKRTPAGREALLEEGVECYRTLIRGLLDITDNLDGDQVIPPDRVVRRDGDDPYLVVAADKGTATFSDIANGVAAEYGFWLGDAFASGGSAGYDHKRMGITARGGWEAVKRHFRELGTNIQKEPFTVVGVGDMSGDVFGNGMLLSRHTRLVGAFNHLHIFLDPTPDAKKSFAERKRLFETPRSTWMEYDRDLISRGGGVFDRAAKSIELSDELQVLLELYQPSASPAEVIRALLRAPVDLLWFGGIGTFVKAAEESDIEVGDRANDAVRVPATALRCRVIGEGANLGVTQRGRIEFALAGGRINTDAIDNSGGVDCSDHEVNIKIALREAIRGGELEVADRNALLEEMTEEVAALVLRDNYLQTQALSLAESRAVELLDQQGRMMRALEKEGRLDRRLEALPGDEEIAERIAARRGLTRPELAVLLAYSKIALYEALVHSDVPDDPLLAGDLLRYFPEPVRLAYRDAVERHRLRREIIATYITNSTVNRVGPSFAFRMTEASGRPAPDVARAYTITRDAFGLRRVWSSIEALDNKVSAGLQLRLLLEAGRLAEHATLWFLRRFDRPLEVSNVVALFRPALRELSANLEPLLSGPARRDLRKRSREYQKEGVPEKLAHTVASLRGLASGVDIVRLAVEAEAEVDQVARIFFSAGERFGFEWLRSAAQRLEIESPWQQTAMESLLDDLYRHQTAIARQVLAGSAGPGWRRAIEVWMEAREHQARRVVRLIEELQAAPRLEIAMLAVAEHELARLTDQ